MTVKPLSLDSQNMVAESFNTEDLNSPTIPGRPYSMLPSHNSLSFMEVPGKTLLL